MKQEKTLNALWFLAAIAVAIGVATFVYAATGLDRCYWSNIDSDFCYSVAGLRFLDGIPSGFVEHTSSGSGLPLVQLLGWTYALASKTGVLSTASFQSLASHPDPLLHLRQFVVAGWLSGAVIFLLIVVTVFWFAHLLTGSNLISLFASIIAAVSWSNVQFLLRIREEALSACMGLLSLYLVFRAVRSTRLSVYGYTLVGSGMALAFSLFAKRNSLPYLAFLPLIFLLTADTAWDRARPGTRILVLKYAAIANLFLGAPLVLLMRYWPEFIASLTLSLVPYLVIEILGFVLLLFLYVLLVFCVRSFQSYGRGRMFALLKHGAYDATTYALLFMAGCELAVYASFVHPQVNAYSLFLLVTLVSGTALTAVSGRRRQFGLSKLIRKLELHRWVSGSTGLVILLAISWGALWHLARISPEAFGAHIEVAVSRVLFEIVHPQSSILFLSIGDNSSPLLYLTSVFAEWWGHYQGSRWPELLIVVLTLFEISLSRNATAFRTVVFLALAGMGMLFFSALRQLFPFYVIYEDLLTILAVSLCFSHLVSILRNRVDGVRATLRATIVLGLAVTLLAFSLVGRTVELRGMQPGDMDVAGCSAPPRGDTCLCDYYYAGTKYGGTGLKEIIEEQYGSNCMQAVEARAVQGIP